MMSDQQVCEVRLEELLNEDVQVVIERERATFDRELAEGRNNVVLFGAGNLGRRVLARLREDGIEPLAFSDNRTDLWGTTLDALRVLPPVEAARRFGVSALFLVTIWNANHRYLETRQQLSELGCSLIRPVSTFRWKHHKQFLPFFWEDQPHQIILEKERVRQAMALWSDEQSRREYVAHLEWRLSGNFDDPAPPVSEESYFPASLFSLEPQEIFVDCGAYDGITLRNFLARRGNSFKGMIAAEPDPANFARLQAYVDTLRPEVRKKVRLHQVAVGATGEVVRFDATGTMASAICPEGSVEVQCVPLDELLAGEEPTYIKMDIEGAEPEALSGARQVVASHRPVLAICLYHRPDDLWALPILIHDLYSGYRLFLRLHEPDGWQLVCYAIPKERVVRLAAG